MPTLTWTIHNQPYIQQTQRRTASDDGEIPGMTRDEVVHQLIAMLTQALRPFADAREAVSKVLLEYLARKGLLPQADL